MTEFYKTKRWDRLRRAVLARDGYVCQESARYGKTKLATTVHHIFPRDEYPQYQWESWNLISLSSDAHNSMHDRTTGALTEQGRQLMQRTARKRNIEL